MAHLIILTFNDGIVANMKERKVIHSLAGLLGLQFILGVLAEHYTEIPDTKPMTIMNGVNYISVHALVAILILGLSAYYLVNRLKFKQPLGIALVGLLGIFVALVTGELFVQTQHDIYSMIMLLGCIVSLAAYILRLKQLHRAS